MPGWIGLALLSGSWLFGVEYYHRTEPKVWMLLIGFGTALLATLPARPLSRRRAVVGLLLAVAAVLCWPSGMRTPICLMALGFLMSLPAVAMVRRMGNGILLSGSVLATQSFALEAYKMFTARSHEPPAPLPGILSGIAGVLGIQSCAHDSTVAIFSMRDVHMLGATWELQLDPVTFLFIVGGVVLVLWQGDPNSLAQPSRGRGFAGPFKALALAAVWLPIRAGLLMSIFLQGVLRTEYYETLNSVHWFWSGWTHLAMLGVPLLMAWRFFPLAADRAESPADGAAAQLAPAISIGRQFLAGLLACAAAAALTAAMLWDPVGPRKQGRVIVEEYNPDPEAVWERTDKPFDTQWYGNKAGYTYYCIFDYLGHFYDVARLTQPISDAVLQDCDVLVLKTPTRPLYTPDEVENIRRFVKRGGGLLLIGEHTNVFGTSARLNPVAKLFGFKFVPDCLFGVDSVFKDVLEPDRAAHPAVQYVKKMDFATSCSLDVGYSYGRAAILAAGLKNKTAEYHVDNFYPQPFDTAQMRYGAFVQLWSTGYGQGRVLGFTDSTDFSNFCVFDPGKSELMMSMVEWLDHRRPPVEPLPWLLALAAVLAGGSCWAARNSRSIRLLMFVAALLGYAVADGAVAASHRASMPRPAPMPDRHPVQVVIDRTVSSSRQPVNGFFDGRPHGFGVFEHWILRLGYFTSRRSGPECFSADVDLLVVPYPRKSVSNDYLRGLTAYVERGGKLLVIDSQKNDKAFIEDADQLNPKDDQRDEPEPGELTASATTNDLLAPFEMSVDHATVLQGELKCDQGLRPVATAGAIRVSGGQPFATIDGHPVGAWRKFGQGAVVVVGYGDRLCDQQMGLTGDVEPDAALRQVYDWEFELVRAIVKGESLNEPKPVMAASPAKPKPNQTLP